MANRKPVNVTKFVFIHNLSMAALSLWMFIETLRAVWVLSLTMTPHGPPSTVVAKISAIFRDCVAADISARCFRLLQDFTYLQMLCRLLMLYHAHAAIPLWPLEDKFADLGVSSRTEQELQPCLPQIGDCDACSFHLKGKLFLHLLAIWTWKRPGRVPLLGKYLADWHDRELFLSWRCWILNMALCA